MRVVGAIPARWGSTRFPGKSLTPLCGKPMIAWVLEGAARARQLDELIVATDDDRIRRAVEGLGHRAVMTRPDHPSGTDRVAEAVSAIEADVVINVQGDEPLIDPTLVDRLASTLLAEPDWEMATAATPLRDEAALREPSVVKVVWDARGRALYFSRSPIPFVRDAGASREGLHWRHLGIYAYRRDFLRRIVTEPPCALERAEMLEQLRALHHGARIKVLTWEGELLGVDTPADVPRVEAILARR